MQTNQDPLERLHRLARCHEAKVRQELAAAGDHLTAHVTVTPGGELELVAEFSLASGQERGVHHYRLNAALESALINAFEQLRADLRSRTVAH